MKDRKKVINMQIKKNISNYSKKEISMKFYIVFQYNSMVCYNFNF
jgi:hypothetical protein